MFKKFRYSKAAGSFKAGFGLTTKTISIISDATSLAVNLGAFGGGGLALLGTASAIGGRPSVIDIGNSPLALRVVILLIISASMGWMLGAIVGWLSKDPSESRRVLGIITAAVCGCLLIFSADWLVPSKMDVLLPELQVFSAIGLGVALWIATFQFRLQSGHVGNRVIRDRALALMTFGIVSVGIIALTLAGEH